ncbi:carboxylate/amino acid/amine transporter [Halomonas elongata]|uniref:Carboxylate/amino acid/amine transporter n=2 Tax=Halomonas elongata TaxID=2746 RepID=E1V8R5_HALED|nr:carboxylate/amino acid/amine transporter [Halomonas elongata]MBW5801475.1 carboxylate/amino acid/amine transporter [Halomonas elongata]OBX37445.1 EamA-like transporter family protein [Halomonas elongata]RAW06799.1 EamA family transporter [Halomonas elongata]WBF18931.1 carboxylate/amino acid/amine transporter [Halomonas elongata]WPU47791.1 carboxylate/amino acid/amine transporter [Halomonas elongata DSM 2581]
MGYLVGVTALWAFSFSLIGVYLAGQVDSYFAVMTRITLATLVFLPVLRPRLLRGRQRLALMALGAVQLGVMYIFSYQAFLLLSVPEVLLFTVLTPLYIALLDDALFKRFTPFHLLTAALAVFGAAVIRYKGLTDDYWLGFLVVQGANLCFALGQVGYRRLSAGLPDSLPRLSVFGWFYLGALAVAVPAFLILGDAGDLPTTGVQWGVLAWLGLVASGAGYFLWNLGAVRVDAGALAIMNNALVPAGLLVNLLIWNQDADLPRLMLGGAIIIGSLALNDWWQRRTLQTA